MTTYSVSITRPAKFFSFLDLKAVFTVWRERQALARLDHSLLEDVGLTPADVAREMNRLPWDMPSCR